MVLFAGLKLSSSNNDPTVSAIMIEQASKEIEKAMKILENEMFSSQKQLTALEEHLANRYLELEANSNRYTIHEYEEIFNSLEAERFDLEEEKSRLQVNDDMIQTNS